MMSAVEWPTGMREGSWESKHCSARPAARFSVLVMQHPSDLGAEMQIINPLWQGTAASHRRSRVWRSRREALLDAARLSVTGDLYGYRRDGKECDQDQKQHES
jgi:hypothetical protein